MTSTRFASSLGILAIVSVVLGGLAGVAWRNFVRLPVYVVQADGRAIISQADLSQIAAADVVFALVGLPVGVLVGAAAWWLLHRAGWPVALLAVAGALTSAFTCWATGLMLGPGDFDTRLAEAMPGESVPIAFELHAWSAVALWAFAAVVVPLFASSLGPETWGPASGSRRRTPTVPAGEVG